MLTLLGTVVSRGTQTTWIWTSVTAQRLQPHAVMTVRFVACAKVSRSERRMVLQEAWAIEVAEAVAITGHPTWDDGDVIGIP